MLSHRKNPYGIYTNSQKTPDYNISLQRGISLTKCKWSMENEERYYSQGTNIR